MSACAARSSSSAASLLRSPDAARVLLTSGGEVPEVGALIKQPELANTIEAIAQQGAAGFYSGRIARDLVNGVRAGGGIWTLEDLAAYRVVERKPLLGEYHGARIVSASPPSSGRSRLARCARYPVGI